MTFPQFTWPDWKKYPRGTRFTDNRSGRWGTLIGPSPCRNNGAIVIWDERPFPVRSVDGEEGHVNFVGIARDATPMPPLKAWDLIGFDGRMPYYPERSLHGPGRVRIKGGRTLYEAVTFYDDTPGEKVKLSRLELRSGLRQVDRWVDPDTELEFVASTEAER